MSVNAPFCPMGPLTLYVGAVAAPAPVQLTAFTPAPNQVEVINTDTALHYLVWGRTASECVAAAGLGVPTTGSPIRPNFIGMLPGTDKVHTLPPNAFFTVLATAGTPNILLTAGDGD